MATNSKVIIRVLIGLIIGLLAGSLLGGIVLPIVLETLMGARTRAEALQLAVMAIYISSIVGPAWGVYGIVSFYRALKLFLLVATGVWLLGLFSMLVVNPLLGVPVIIGATILLYPLCAIQLADGIEGDEQASPSSGTITDSGNTTASSDAPEPQSTETEEAVTTWTSVPQAVPGVPRLSLTYDAIQKGDPIGKGGNADVYAATVTTDDGEITLALKEPRMGGTLHTETVERMMQEAETWQQLDDHDHIVGVVDYDSEPLPWIAMEYMDAGHLGERAGEMPFEQALWTAIATTKAVRHAHRRGVAHLDLKPENILFREVDDGWDVPKVADLGLSKHLLRHSKSVEGVTPDYAAPEQFDEEYGEADDITDIYQLGTVFYELFTARPPFEGKPFKVMNRIQHEDPEPPSAVADVPAELDEILLRAMATEKDDRYETVIYLRDEFQQLRDDLTESGQL